MAAAGGECEPTRRYAMSYQMARTFSRIAKLGVCAAEETRYSMSMLSAAHKHYPVVTMTRNRSAAQTPRGEGGCALQLRPKPQHPVQMPPLVHLDCQPAPGRRLAQSHWRPDPGRRYLRPPPPQCAPYRTEGTFHETDPGRAESVPQGAGMKSAQPRRSPARTGVRSSRIRDPGAKDSQESDRDGTKNEKEPKKKHPLACGK